MVYQLICGLVGKSLYNYNIYSCTVISCDNNVMSCGGNMIVVSWESYLLRNHCSKLTKNLSSWMLSGKFFVIRTCMIVKCFFS